MSIVVPCLNEAAHIESFIDSLERQERGPFNREVIFADGMSNDGTREILSSVCATNSTMRLIDNPGRTVSAGLNLALAQATGEIVIRMDVHTEYATDYVRESVAVLLETGAENVGGPALTKAVGYMSRAIAAAYANAFACGGAKFHNPSYEGYVDTVTYGCWWRRTLEELGGFDETLVRNQDDELNLRIIRAGWKIWQTPRITSWYYPRGSLKALALQYFQYGYWKVAVIRKHRQPASWRHLVPVAFLLFAVLGSAAPILGCWDAVARHFVVTLYLAVLGGYVACDIGASFRAAALHGRALFLALLIVFPVYHLSYGAGFLAGMLLSARSRSKPPCQPSYAVKLSR